MSLELNNINTKNFSRQPYKGQGIYKAPGGGVEPVDVVNYYQNNTYNLYADNITINGSLFNSFIAPFSKTLDTVYFFNRSAAGTHYPVQISLYNNPDPELDSVTWTKQGQSGNISMTTNGLKVLSGVNLPVIQGQQYNLGIHRAASGGTTTPLVLGRTSAFNNVFANVSGSNFADTTPASFTTVLSANTVAGLTAGGSISNTYWFYLGFI